METVLSLCEVQVFSTEGLSPKTICSKDAPVDEVDIFDDSCYIFTEGEVSGYDEADRRCQRESPDFHLLDKLTELSTDYVKARLESRIKAEGGPRSMFAWVGAQRSPDSRRGKEIWNWISDGSEGRLSIWLPSEIGDGILSYSFLLDRRHVVIVDTPNFSRS